MFTEVEDPISALMQETHPKASERDAIVEHTLRGKQKNQGRIS